MSSVNDPTKTDGYLKSCTRLVAFRLPICKPTLDYHASFKSSLGTPEAMQLIQSLSEARGGMVSAYQSSGSFEVKIKAAEDYIPLLYQLLDTMQNSPKLRLDKDLTFEWQGGICNKGEFFKSHDALYELIMVLHAKAMYHALAALNLVTADPLAFLTESGKHLLEASSIMKLLSTNFISGGWKKQFSRRAPNPAELDENVCAALAILFKGQAQAMSFMKSANLAATPSTIKARLAVGVVNSMGEAFAAFGSAPDCVALYGDYMAHIHIKKQLYTALAYQYAAQAYQDKNEVGNAIAFCEAAKARLVQQKSSVRPTWSAAGLPKFAGVHEELGHGVGYIVDSVNQLQKQAEQDNKFVYFQPVPGPNSTNSSAGLPLPDLPVEASVMNPPLFKVPERKEPVTVFVYKAKPSVFSSMLSSLVGGGAESSKTAPPPPEEDAASQAAAPGPGGAPTTSTAPSDPQQSTDPSAPVPMGGYTDEHYARYLQKQFDAEAVSGKGPPAPVAGSDSSASPPAPKFNSLV